MSEQRDFRLLLISSLLTLGSFGLLLPVVPLWAEAGGASPTGVGATNFAFLTATVLAQLGAPRTLRLLGHRESLLIGGVLLGLPVAAYPLTSALPALLAVSALRGVGFALVVVTGSAMVARLLPAHRRGRGLGQYGLATGLPNVLYLPTGPWLAERLGFTLVFLLGALLPLAGAVIVSGMRLRTREPRVARSTSVRRTGTVRLRDLAPAFVVTCCAALASSAYVTFLPAAVPVTVTATVGLFGYSIGGLVGRWASGVVVDRYRRPVLLVPGAVACGVGALAPVLAVGDAHPVRALSAAALGGLVFGVGFGAVSNSTLTAMFDRVDTRGYDVASTVWNMSVDAGMAIGSLTLGVVADVMGYPVMFAVAAGLVTLAIVPAVPVSRRERAT